MSFRHVLHRLSQSWLPDGPITEPTVVLEAKMVPHSFGALAFWRFGVGAEFSSASFRKNGQTKLLPDFLRVLDRMRILSFCCMHIIDCPSSLNPSALFCYGLNPMRKVLFVYTTKHLTADAQFISNTLFRESYATCAPSARVLSSCTMYGPPGDWPSRLAGVIP